MMNKKGIFISFEGPDGSGKTSVAKYIFKKINDLNLPVVETREPGGKNNLIAEDIRDILLNHFDYKIDYRAEALLFAASRAQHVSDFILPNLNKGNIVLCDRYIHSSLVYQGYVRGLGINEVFEINKFAIQNTMPDIVVLLMVRPEVGINRIFSNPNRDVNRLDKESINSLHQKVYHGYKKLLENDFGKQIIVIDAELPEDEVKENAWKEVYSFIKNNGYIK